MKTSYRFELAFIFTSICFASQVYAADGTGIFCKVTPSGKVVTSWYCGKQNPGSEWTKVSANCFHSKVATRSCDSIAASNPVFDKTQYLQKNGDVLAEFLRGALDPHQHWQLYGRYECRIAHDTFNVRDYLSANKDVADYYRNSCAEAIGHYSIDGIHEGRLTLAAKKVIENRLFVFPGIRAASDGSFSFAIQRFSLDNKNDATVIAGPIRTSLDTSVVTGLPNIYRDKSVTMIGPPQDPIDSKTGFNGVQQIGGSFGIGIDSRVALIGGVKRDYLTPNGVALQNDLMTITMDKIPLKAWVPWTDAGGSLSTSMLLRIPFAGGSGGGGSQINTYYLIEDVSLPSKPKRLWLGATIFDTRSSMFGSINSTLGDSNIIYVKDSDQAGSSGLPIFILQLRPGSKYLTIPPNTLPSSCIVNCGSSSSGYPKPSQGGSVVHSETRLYQFDIEMTNMLEILAKVRRVDSTFSADPRQYRVLSWNLNPEVFGVAKKGPQGWIGLSGKVLRVGPRQ